jgi:hypothetical protein
MKEWLWKAIIKLMPMNIRYQVVREELRDLSKAMLAELVSQERNDLHIHKNPPKTKHPHRSAETGGER